MVRVDFIHRFRMNGGIYRGESGEAVNTFLKLSLKANPKGISVTCVSITKIQYGELVSPIPKKSAFQPCTFHVILLILCLSS